MTRSSLSLVVACKGVVFESVSIVGANIGVKLMTAGGIIMNKCEVHVHNCNTGLHLEGYATLGATDLKVVNCATVAISLIGNSTAEVKDCAISGTKHEGVLMTEYSRVCGSTVRFVGCEKSFVCLSDKSQLNLIRPSFPVPPVVHGVIKDDTALVLCPNTHGRKFSTEGYGTVCLWK